MLQPQLEEWNQEILRLPQNLYLALRKYSACHKICTRPCQSAAPDTKSAPDLAKELRLPRNLTRPRESVAPATKSAPDLAKVSRLPRNLHAPPCAPAPMGFAMRPCQRCGNAAPATNCYLALRKCCACHEIYIGHAKVLRLPRNSIFAKPPRCCYSGHPSRDRPNRRRGRGTFRTSSAATSCALPGFCAFSIFSRTQTRCWNTAPATKSALNIPDNCCEDFRVSDTVC